MNILMNFRAFPVAMGRWFEWTLKDLGHKVLVAGPTMGDEVPWPNGPHHFPQYNFPPDIELPDIPEFPLKEVWKIVRKKFHITPDIVLQAGDTCYLSGYVPKKMRNSNYKNIILATDPHAIDYWPRLTFATHFACMQKYYGGQYKRDFIWIPYAYYPPVHFKIPNFPKRYDIVFVGLLYDERREFLEKAEASGLKVFNSLGVIYDEYNKIYNQGLIAFNHSSRLDLPARFWEGLAMGNLVLTNRIPELEYIKDEYFIEEDKHYIAYSTIDEAVEKAQYYISHLKEASDIAIAGHLAVKEHTYEDRVKKLLWEIL